MRKLHIPRHLKHVLFVEMERTDGITVYRFLVRAFRRVYTATNYSEASTFVEGFDAGYSAAQPREIVK